MSRVITLGPLLEWRESGGCKVAGCIQHHSPSIVTGPGKPWCSCSCPVPHFIVGSGKGVEQDEEGSEVVKSHSFIACFSLLFFCSLTGRMHLHLWVPPDSLSPPSPRTLAEVAFITGVRASSKPMRKAFSNSHSS